MATLRLAAQYATALMTDSSRTTRGVDTPFTHDCRSDRLSVIYITHLPAPGPTVENCFNIYRETGQIEILFHVSSLKLTFCVPILALACWDMYACY